VSLITDQTRDLNPWHLQAGDPCYQILINLDTTYHDGQHAVYSGKVSVPAGMVAGLEEAATVAFSVAQQDGMQAALMAYCAFYFYDEAEDGWRQFL
jgi:hypothetical protein